MDEAEIDETPQDGLVWGDFMEGDAPEDSPQEALLHLSDPIPVDWLNPDNPPPRRPMVLTGDGGIGVLPRGIVALLIAAGGVGKSFAMTQLALAIAAGKPWLSTFYPERPGRVAMLFGEEDSSEVHRRFATAADAAALSRKKRRHTAGRIHAVGIAGSEVALFASHNRFEPPESTPFFHELVDRLTQIAESDPNGLDLVGIDPASRFMGLIDENTNSIATRFVQLLESIAKLPGSPAVLLAAHTPKNERQANAPPRSPRGASALFDGARAVFALAPEPDGSIKLSFEKANYTQRHPNVILTRGPHGALLFKELEARLSLTPGSADQRVLDVLVAAASPMNRSSLRQALGGMRIQQLNSILESLEECGIIKAAAGPRKSKVYSLVDQLEAPDIT